MNLPPGYVCVWGGGGGPRAPCLKQSAAWHPYLPHVASHAGTLSMLFLPVPAHTAPPCTPRCSEKSIRGELAVLEQRVGSWLGGDGAGAAAGEGITADGDPGREGGENEEAERQAWLLRIELAALQVRLRGVAGRAGTLHA
jgi:hypothetical protein